MKTVAAILGLALLSASCDGAPSTRESKPSQAVQAADSGFLAPPKIVAARRLPDGDLALNGSAMAGAAIRLASPGGSAFSATADGVGGWTITVPKLQQAMLFGLSAKTGDRLVQAEGYVALLPEAEFGAAPLGAMLRAGAGAESLGAEQAGAYIAAVDLDTAGAAMVSGPAPAGAPLKIAVDSSPDGDGAANGSGRFSVALVRPLNSGIHRIEVTAPAAKSPLSLAADIVVSAPIRPAAGPYRSERVKGGWRIDWITPGGGLQTTILFDRPEAAG